jgi:hypothetical protein
VMSQNFSKVLADSGTPSRDECSVTREIKHSAFDLTPARPPVAKSRNTFSAQES